MRIQVTIPDGVFSDALISEAAKRNQSEASLIAAYARTVLNKYKYGIPAESKIRRGRGKVHGRSGGHALHVRANGSQRNLSTNSGEKNA